MLSPPSPHPLCMSRSFGFGVVWFTRVHVLAPQRDPDRESHTLTLWKSNSHVKHIHFRLQNLEFNKNMPTSSLACTQTFFFFNGDVLKPRDQDTFSCRYAGRQSSAKVVKTAGYLPSTGVSMRLLEMSGGNILFKKQPGRLAISDYPEATSERLETSIGGLEAYPFSSSYIPEKRCHYHRQ